MNTSAVLCVLALLPKKVPETKHTKHQANKLDLMCCHVTEKILDLFQTPWQILHSWFPNLSSLHN